MLATLNWAVSPKCSVRVSSINFYRTETEDALSPVRKQEKRGRKGATYRRDRSVRTVKEGEVEIWDGPSSTVVQSIDHHNRWRILEYRTSDVPLVRSVPKMRVPNKKELKYRQPEIAQYGHGAYRRATMRADSEFECWCGHVHKMWFRDHHSRKPEFARFSTFIPEFAVLTESEIEDVFSIEIPAAPEAPETLTPEQVLSKKYLQHLVRKYEVRKSEFERKKRLRGEQPSALLAASSELPSESDFSLMKSIDVILPDERLWVVIFTERWETDRGLSAAAAHRMQAKLSKHNIPNIEVKVSASSYSAKTGFDGQKFIGRFEKSERKDRASQAAKRKKKGSNFQKSLRREVL